MSLPPGLAAGTVGTAVAALVAWPAPFAARARVAVNYRGVRVPLTLGVAAASGSIAALAVAGVASAASNTGNVAGPDLATALALAMVFAAGAYDDRQPSRTHGLRNHFAALAKGRVTSGIVKLAVVVAAAALAVAASGLSGAALALAIPVVAGAANLFNLLDVAPGRALKYALLCSVALLAANPWALAWASAGEAAILLPLDVRERAMLGDAGANTVGFVLGLLLADAVGTPALAVALAVILALHALAETVTLSRIIVATPPLRWFDGLGRLPVENHGTAAAESG